MPLFEVFIPTTDPNGFNITARLQADNWMQALRNGLSKLGDTTDVKNVLCDIQEDAIDVTEPRSGRVFRIRELHGAPAAPAASAAEPGPVPLTSPVVPLTAPKSATPVPLTQPKAPQPTVLGAPPPAAKVRFASTATEETVTRQKASETPAFRPIGRAVEPRADEEAADKIAELFEETQRLYDHPKLAGAANFILDLAMKTVACESGAVFISDINAQDLYFAAARGPKAQEVLKFRVPMGQGIVGFSAQEGVSLAINDVHKDPRFYAAISKSLGYETKAILCAPVQKEGRVYGALELINKKQGTSFTLQENNLLSYLALAFADYIISTGQTGD